MIFLCILFCYITDIESPQISCPEENAITVLEIPIVTNKVMCLLQLGADGQKRITCEVVDDSEISAKCNFQVEIKGS